MLLAHFRGSVSEINFVNTKKLLWYFLALFILLLPVMCIHTSIQDRSTASKIDLENIKCFTPNLYAILF